jgi:hypothetical protein
MADHFLQPILRSEPSLAVGIAKRYEFNPGYHANGSRRSSFNNLGRRWRNVLKRRRS